MQLVKVILALVALFSQVEGLKHVVRHKYGRRMNCEEISAEASPTSRVSKTSEPSATSQSRGGTLNKVSNCGNSGSTRQLRVTKIIIVIQCHTSRIS